MKKHKVFWIQFNVSILWCPENILLLLLRIESLTIDFQILILTYRYIKLTEAVVTAAKKTKKKTPYKSNFYGPALAYD